jgi:exodeoxyribonuclease V alpha subunit
MRGILTDIKFQRDGFLIGALAGGETVLGNLTEPLLGQEYLLTGEWIDTPRWGRQFKFQHYRIELPQDTDGICRYITRARWVGHKTARQMVKSFGQATLEVLKNDPQRVAETITGITLDRAQEISRVLKEQEELEATIIELETILGGHRVPKQTIPALVQRFGADAPARLRQDPYLLTEMRGIGFITADRVAMGIGFERGGRARLKAAILHVLRDVAETRGHTWLSSEKLEDHLQKLIGLPSHGVALELSQTGHVTIQDEMIALADLARDEAYVAGSMRILLEASNPAKFELATDGLAEDQKAAARQVLAHNVFILTGGPGTGKTHTLKRIVDGFAAQDYRILLAAPTGKAAKRMSEMIGREASTIHRMLGPEPYEENGEVRFSFQYGEISPLPADLVVVDEFSMVDVSLAASLLRAIAPGTRLLIVGDHYQLPSVGPGSVLRDLLATAVPSCELTEIKRNTGDIVKACHAIKDSLPVIPSPQLVPEEGLNFRHLEISDPFQIQEIIREIVTGRMPQRGYDPVWDVQVISPMNEKTLLSCLHLNAMLQAALNPGPLPHGLLFRVGDKVLQRKNEVIDAELIVNGDLGTVREVDDAGITVDFRYPERTVQIPRKDHNLALAFCLTIHKMQGSEAPVVIIPVHQSFGAFFNRELIYTAISRARDICITIGQWGALEQTVGRVGNNRRTTRLAQLVQGEG